MALNCRAHSKSTMLEGERKTMERRYRDAQDVRPKGRNLSVEVVSLLLRHQFEAQSSCVARADLLHPRSW